MVKIVVLALRGYGVFGCWQQQNVKDVKKFDELAVDGVPYVETCPSEVKNQ
jgi:hypothetical protein